MLIFKTTYAQQNQPQTHYYYIEEASYDLLKPTKTTENQDGTIDLEFADESLSAFFEGFTIYSYVREFGWSKDVKHHKYYLVGLDSDEQAQNLQAHNAIVFSEYVGTMEKNTLGTPNDYYNHSNLDQHWFPYPNPDGWYIPENSPKGYEHLELVNARRAWHITQGSSNITIGIRDVQFYNSHPDIDDKIFANETTSQTNDPDYTHGLSVSGIAAGETNNFGIASIGYNSKIVPINQYNYATAVLYLAQNYPQVKVVNISMGSVASPPFSSVNEGIYEDVWDNYGVTTVVAAGNGQFQSGTNPNNYFLPASYEHTISVSSVGSYHKYGFVDDQGRSYDVKDLHEVAVGHTAFTHQHNDKVHIVAPGYSVAQPKGFSSYGLGWGTSYAAPMVAGTAALMYDVYPTIHPDDVLRILQETADDKIYNIPENAAYAPTDTTPGLLGAGRLNAYGAVLKAQCEYNGDPIGLDLNMQDTKEDYGDEPYFGNDPIWNSPDIWVRNTNDGFLYKESEDLHFVDSNTPVYVYVRVTNDSCHTNTGNEQLELYWAKGGLNQTWPDVWNGSSNAALPIGGAVDTLSIPQIAPGKYEILEFEWQPQDPELYENLGFEKPWMFCFLSRIVTQNDLMAFPEGPNAATNTRNNNNIAYHNATVINVNQLDNQGSVFAGNFGGDDTITTNIEFFTNLPEDDNIWSDAEVRVELNEDLWDLWQSSGAQSSSVRVLDPTRRQIIAMSNHASLNAIDMAPDEWGIATVGVNFLIHEVDGQEEYNLHVQQVLTDTQESLGGFTYRFFRDNERQEFNAETSQTENTDGSETFYAQNINEGAKYNWYDEDGVLIYSGSDFTVSSLVAKEYKLEVIADYDGHIDYKTVETEDKRGIEYLSPNPASTTVDIGYFISEHDNGYIMLTHSITGLSYNYVLNSTNTNQVIPVDQLASSTYIVNLIANGEIIATENLIIN